MRTRRHHFIRGRRRLEKRALSGAAKVVRANECRAERSHRATPQAPKLRSARPLILIAAQTKTCFDERAHENGLREKDAVVDLPVGKRHIGRGIDDAARGVTPPVFFGERPAIEGSGETNIGHQHLSLDFAHQEQGMLGRLGFHDDKARVFERRHDIHTDEPFVLGNECGAGRWGGIVRQLLLVGPGDR